MLLQRRLQHVPHVFISFSALRLLFSVFTQGCSRSTRAQRGPECPSNAEYEMPPQAMPCAMSRVRGGAYARSAHCFSSHFGFWTFASSLRSIDAGKDCGGRAHPRNCRRVLACSEVVSLVWTFARSLRSISIFKRIVGVGLAMLVTVGAFAHSHPRDCFNTGNAVCSILAHAKAVGIKLQHWEPIYSLKIQPVRTTTLKLFRTCKYCKRQHLEFFRACRHSKLQRANLEKSQHLELWKKVDTAS